MANEEISFLDIFFNVLFIVAKYWYCMWLLLLCSRFASIIIEIKNDIAERKFII